MVSSFQGNGLERVSINLEKYICFLISGKIICKQYPYFNLFPLSENTSIVIQTVQDNKTTKIDWDNCSKLNVVSSYPKRYNMQPNQNGMVLFPHFFIG